MKCKRILLLSAVMIFVSMAGLSQRVRLVGDSHIALKTYPETLKEILAVEAPQVDFDSFGIGAAGFYTYNDKPANMEKVYKLDPEILVVALGTNDCNNWYYTPEKLTERATRFYNNVKERFPDCKVVFVSPFFFKTKEVRGSKLEINPNVEATASVYNELAATLPDVYAIDLVAEHGMDFLERDMLRKDYIHLTNEGYRYLARLVADGLLSIPGLINDAPIPVYPE